MNGGRLIFLLKIVSGAASLDELYPTLQRKYNVTYSQQVKVTMKSHKFLTEEEYETVSRSAEKALISHRERETAKVHLEEIYANRSFSLASVIL